MKKNIALISVLVLVVSVCFATGMAKPPIDEFASDYCYLVDYDSGRVLVDKNSNEKRPIASMVKIMTLLLTFENIENAKLDYNDMVVISHESARQTGSEMFLDEGESYSVSDIIKGVVTMSANDGSVALAEQIAGSESAFVDLMNEKAVSLGMKDTLYANATGLPTQSKQYSTAHDVTVLMRELVKYEKYHEYCAVWLEDYAHPSGRITQLANTNKLIRHYKGCDSGKTGYTDSAKYCLSASAIRDGMRVVGTVMGADTSKLRFKAMSDMFNYAFANFKRKVYLSAEKPLNFDVKVSGGKTKVLTPVTAKDLSVLVGKGDSESEIKYDIPETVKAPISKGQKIGTVSLVSGDKVVATVDVVSNVSIAKANFWDIIKDLVD